MPVALLTLLLLPAVCQGTKLISLATKSDSSDPPFEADFVDPATGRFTKLVDLGVDSIPVSSVLRDDNTLVYTTLFGSNDSSCLTTVDLSTGKVERGPLETSAAHTFSQVGFDTVTKQTFVIMDADHFSDLYEVLPNQSLHRMAKNIGIVDATTYSSSKHAFFFAGEMRNVVTVSTVGEQAGKILYNVSVGFELAALIYDDTNGVLYGWSYDADDLPLVFAHLVSLDYTTGKILKTFYQSYFLLYTAPTATCIDKAGSTIYTSFYDMVTNRTVIHTLTLSRGNSSHVPADLYAGTMNCL